MRKKALVTSITLGILGIALAVSAPAWVAGSLSISAAAATQIVTAINVGGWALTVVIAIFGGGVISAIIGIVRYKIMQIGVTLAAA